MSSAPKGTGPIAEAVEALARGIDAVVTEARGRVEFYSSDRLPPGYRSRASFNEACREGRIAGAHKCGRIWAVRIEDFHAPKPTKAPEATTTKSDDPVTRAERSFLLARSRQNAA